MPKVTIRDVAQQAGVGIGTVSRVLNNSPRVSDDMRQHVLSVIDELGFKPDTVARQLARKSRFQYIGIITRPFFNYDSFTARLRGVQRVLQAYDDYEMMLFSLSSGDSYEERLMSIITTRTIDGLLIIDLNLTEDQKEALRAANMPFVGLNHLKASDWPCIGTDNIIGGYRATKHLLELGHRRIGYVGDYLVDVDGFITSAQRYNGYVKALHEYGVAVNSQLTRFGPYGAQAAYRMMEAMLKLPERPTAVFAMSDTQAFGCIEAINAAGLRVPDDISVIGYDDIETSHHVGLTTVSQHLEHSGVVGTEYLLHLLHDSTPPTETPDLPPPEVIVRRTTRKLNQVARNR